MNAFTLLTAARLPRWCLRVDWPMQGGQPALADLQFLDGRLDSVTPHSAHGAQGAEGWNVNGAPVLPGLIEAHTHIDKAFTLERMVGVAPGLLAAIEAMKRERSTWTVDDVQERASRALQTAFDNGVVKLRTHCDWWEPTTTPLAWRVLGELASHWVERVAVERVSLMPLQFFGARSDARQLAALVSQSGAGVSLGGFVHTSTWSPSALRNLLEAAADFGLDVDLHIDEELNPQAEGLATTAKLLREMAFAGRVVCGHCCALAAQPEALALATLDSVAQAPITMIALPLTNLLLQDAQVGRTARLRGVTLVKEARERGIPVLVSSDNVQDSFCAVGNFDPVEALSVGVLAAQLQSPFDVWSESICRGDWLARTPESGKLRLGARADFVVFEEARAPSWPARSHRRTVLRDGKVAAGTGPLGNEAAQRKTL
jgi:cytosine deaminase